MLLDDVLKRFFFFSFFSAKQCDEPPIPENGYAEGCDGDRAVGTTCTYSCIQGHRLVGESATVCTPHKTWTNTGAACNRKEPSWYPSCLASRTYPFSKLSNTAIPNKCDRGQS